jgi:phage tail protein X
MIAEKEDTALTSACFQAIKAQEADAQNLPWIAKVNINMETRGEKRRLILTSAQSIDEPILGLAIQVGCGADVTREYLLMLSPPTLVNAEINQPLPPPRSAQQTEKPVARQAPPPKPSPKPTPKPAAAQTSSTPAHTWIIGKGESVSSLASALYPDNAKMRRTFAQAVFQANPDLALDYSSRDTLPQGLVLAVPDLKKLANSPAAAVEQPADSIVRPVPPKASESPTPNNTKPQVQESAETQSDRLLVSEIGDADAYPGDLVFRERLAASRQELHQLNRFVESSLPPSNDPELMALQRRMAALQGALKNIQAAESGIQPAVQKTVVASAEDQRPNTLSVSANKSTSAQDSWHGLLAGGGMALVGIALGIWLGAIGRDAVSTWRQRKEF